MKLPLLPLLLPTVLADFWMVYQRRHAASGRAEVTTYGTSFVSNMTTWTCDADAFGHHVFHDRMNVNKHFGIHYEPWNDVPGPLWHDPLVRIDVNLTSFGLGRQTITRTSNNTFNMVNAQNITTGECHENRTFIIDLDCWWRHPDPRKIQYHVNINGSSMLFCQSGIEVHGVRDAWDMFGAHGGMRVGEVWVG